MIKVTLVDRTLFFYIAALCDYYIIDDTMLNLRIFWVQWWGQKGILVNWECMVQKLVREYAVGQGKSASDSTLGR